MITCDDIGFENRFGKFHPNKFLNTKHIVNKAVFYYLCPKDKIPQMTQMNPHVTKTYK